MTNKFPVYGVWSFGTEKAELFESFEEAESWVSFREDGEDLFFITSIHDQRELDCFLYGPD